MQVDGVKPGEVTEKNPLQKIYKGTMNKVSKFYECKITVCNCYHTQCKIMRLKVYVQFSA